jgi:hypothetical protein
MQLAVAPTSMGPKAAESFLVSSAKVRTGTRLAQPEIMPTLSNMANAKVLDRLGAFIAGSFIDARA